ncbi:CD83 antigen [Mugil cephalus]|uniref:CD83 antigen n=1 Tax=Mugil cephalus TaxID=48193 RepID=UPI001FB65512|nr:CD83 antigen [Mugil cephalus]
MMSTVMLNAALLLLSLCVCHSVGMTLSEDMEVVEALSGDDGTLRCTANPKPGVQYMAVKWYKVRDGSPTHNSGLLMRDLLNGTTRWFIDVEREVELLTDSRSIFLPNVTCSDSGVYMCQLAAPVGQQNREGKILLTLTDCLDNQTETLLADSYLVIFAVVLLMVALVIFLISYSCLKNTLRDKKKTPKKETLMEGILKPLDKKDLKLIYTLGPKTSTMKHVCV